MIRGISKASVNIRTGPGSTFPPTGRYLSVGDQIEASENAAQWLHLTKINGLPVTADNWWASAGSNEQYISWEEVTDPDPGPGPNPDDVVEIISSTVTYKTASGEIKTANLKPVP